MIANNSDAVDGLKILERQHKSLIWMRGSYTNAVRAALREFYQGAVCAFGDDLSSSDAISVLKIAPTPTAAKKLTIAKLEIALRKGGRQRNVTKKAVAILSELKGDYLLAPAEIEEAFGISVLSMVCIIEQLKTQINTLEKEIESHFKAHPDSQIILSLPGLGVVLGARILGELGDDPNYYPNAKSRKNAAGTSPITVASGKKKVVNARFVKNNRTIDACDMWALCSLSNSQGARELYDRRRAMGDSHHQALRKVANRLIGILHGCLKTRTIYDENIAWPNSTNKTSTESVAA